MLQRPVESASVFRACVDLIADHICSIMEPTIAKAQAHLDQTNDVEVLIDAFVTLHLAMAKLLFDRRVLSNYELLAMHDRFEHQPRIAAQTFSDRIREPIDLQDPSPGFPEPLRMIP